MTGAIRLSLNLSLNLNLTLDLILILTHNSPIFPLPAPNLTRNPCTELAEVSNLHAPCPAYYLFVTNAIFLLFFLQTSQKIFTFAANYNDDT